MSRFSVRRFLGSRRLAVVLFAVGCAYFIFATLIPQGAPDSPQVEAFASGGLLAGLIVRAGFSQAYAHPAFLLLAALFTASTAVCAAERSLYARKVVLDWGSAGSRYVTGLAQASGVAIPVPPHVSEAQARGAAEKALRKLRMRTHAHPIGIWAHKSRWAIWGSPVFHLALVGVFVSAGVGQLVRWEGVLGIQDGETVQDHPSAYHSYVAGPFSRHEEGRYFSLNGLDANLVVDGVERGPAPHVTLGGGSDSRTQHVYPNSPLRFGSTYVHSFKQGASADVRFADSGGENIGTARLEALDDRMLSGGTLPLRAQIAASQRALDLTLSVHFVPGTGGLPELPEEPEALVTLAQPGAAVEDELGTVRPGDTVMLPDGQGILYVDTIRSHAWLLVVDDPTIPAVYFFLVLSCVGAGVALLLPPRAVFVRYESDARGSRIEVITRRRRVDPLFPGVVRAALEEALGELGVG